MEATTTATISMGRRREAAQVAAAGLTRHPPQRPPLLPRLDPEPRPQQQPLHLSRSNWFESLIDLHGQLIFER